MRYIYTIEYYLVTKIKDTMKCGGKSMELENIILNEVTQTQKDRYGVQTYNWTLAIKCRITSAGQNKLGDNKYSMEDV